MKTWVKNGEGDTTSTLIKRNNRVAILFPDKKRLRTKKNINYEKESITYDKGVTFPRRHNA